MTGGGAGARPARAAARPSANQIIELLKSQGQHDKAGQADTQLPDEVDTDNDEHRRVLGKLSIDASMVTDKLGGGALGGALGKIV